MRGTVGDRPIAMIVTLENNTHPIAAHYSYASQGKIIPLSIKIAGQKIILSEAGGMTFNLNFVPPNKQNKTPLSFYTAVGLQGNWSDQTETRPVSLQFIKTRNHLKDCIFYPDSEKSDGPRFYDTGCEHTPDKKLIDMCVHKKYISDKSVNSCIDRSIHNCRSDQSNMNICANNITYYLNGLIEDHFKVYDTRSSGAHAYQIWMKKVSDNCRIMSDFSPDGSGFPADMDLCASAEQLRFIQNGFHIMALPIRQHPSSHQVSRPMNSLH